MKTVIVSPMSTASGEVIGKMMILIHGHHPELMSGVASVFPVDVFCTDTVDGLAEYIVSFVSEHRCGHDERYVKAVDSDVDAVFALLRDNACKTHPRYLH